MGDERFEWTGLENDLLRTGKEFSIQLCRLENHNCYCRNSEIANTDIMDINSHNSASARRDQLGGGNEAASSKLKLKHYSCDQCDKLYDTTRELNSNREIHENKIEKSGVAEKGNIRPTNSKDFVTAERLNSPRSSFLCPLCTKVVKGNRFHLEVHLRTHTKEKPFVCQVCNKGFVHSTNLSRHKIVHTGKKPYVCQVCSKGFTQQGNLKIHKRTHTGEKPYICTVCSKGFTNKSNLDMHIRVHTDERPYRCTICTKGFKERRKLERHKKTHERNKK